MEPLLESVLRALRPDGKLFVQADGQQSAVEHAMVLAGFTSPAAGPANTVTARKPAYEVREAPFAPLVCVSAKSKRRKRH